MEKKIILHACFCIAFMTLSYYAMNTLEQVIFPRTKTDGFHASYFRIILLLFQTLCTWILLTYQLLTMMGILVYNSFNNEVILKYSPKSAPFICFRTVTRGNFPDLIRKNLNLNRQMCVQAGLKNFVIEVVTDKEIDMSETPYVKQAVVPPSYATKSGVLFKARALQYAIEANVSGLNDEDWVVHLDEETLLTHRSIYGIINFVTENKHHFGQGLVTYTGAGVVNWTTTMLDFWRVAEDLGKIRLQLKWFRKIFAAWKGSFIVCKFGAERSVSFDHGIESSIAEDIFFGHIATSKGYTFDFIEGEMLEKSPFTLKDLFMQRRRWHYGILLSIHSDRIYLKDKFFIGLVFYSSLFMMISGALFSNSNVLFPWYLEQLYGIPYKLNILTFFYETVFGIIKSYTMHEGHSLKCLFICLAAALPSIILNSIVHTLSTISVVFMTHKFHFHIVKKE